MSKILKVQVVKTFYTDVYIAVPDDFDGSLSRYSNAIQKEADQMSPRQIDILPWIEDREAFEFDDVPVFASQKEINSLGLMDIPEEKPNY